jgi:hypothetical protein
VLTSSDIPLCEHPGLLYSTRILTILRARSNTNACRWLTSFGCPRRSFKPSEACISVFYVVMPDQPAVHRFGFHIPPFNSVNHIHLHAQGLPYLNLYREKKYRTANPNLLGKVKGFSWFAEYDQCVRILESGGRVGVFPC